MNYFVDRFFRMSYMIVDDFTKHEIVTVKDQHWDQSRPILPHTIASSSKKVCDKAPRWRLEKYKMKENEEKWAKMPNSKEIVKEPIVNNHSKETKALLADLNDV